MTGKEESLRNVDLVASVLAVALNYKYGFDRDSIKVDIDGGNLKVTYAAAGVDLTPEILERDFLINKDHVSIEGSTLQIDIKAINSDVTANIMKILGEALATKKTLAPSASARHRRGWSGGHPPYDIPPSGGHSR